MNTVSKPEPLALANSFAFGVGFNGHQSVVVSHKLFAEYPDDASGELHL